jgi:hypothetical protein
MRIHARAKNALWFGPGSGRQPIHRFDDPTGRFRVCYLGTTIEVCFAETFLRNPPVRILALDDLAGRSIATVELRRDLRLVPIHGSSLARLGVTAELASGSDYVGSQPFAGLAGVYEANAIVPAGVAPNPPAAYWRHAPTNPAQPSAAVVRRGDGNGSENLSPPARRKIDERKLIRLPSGDPRRAAPA